MQPSNPFIQRSAWKVFFANFGFTAFSEVRIAPVLFGRGFLCTDRGASWLVVHKTPILLLVGVPSSSKITSST
jgi:hypothetical protein